MSFSLSIDLDKVGTVVYFIKPWYLSKSCFVSKVGCRHNSSLDKKDLAMFELQAKLATFLMEYNFSVERLMNSTMIAEAQVPGRHFIINI